MSDNNYGFYVDRAEVADLLSDCISDDRHHDRYKVKDAVNLIVEPLEKRIMELEEFIRKLAPTYGLKKLECVCYNNDVTPKQIYEAFQKANLIDVTMYTYPYAEMVVIQGMYHPSITEEDIKVQVENNCSAVIRQWSNSNVR